MAAEKGLVTIKGAIGISVGTLVLGLALGTAMAPTPVTPDPVTVTKTVTPSPVTVIPASCMAALDTADLVDLQTRQVFGLFSKSNLAIQMQEWGANTLILNDVDALTTKILANRDAYQSAASTCRSGDGV